MNHRLNLLQEAQHEFWKNNLLVLQAFIEGLGDKSLDLERFNELSDGKAVKPKIEHTCESVACIGGWVAVIPYFKDLGIKRDKEGGFPMYGPDDDGDTTENASLFLFGWKHMFHNRGGHDESEDEEHSELTDRQIALRRIKKRLKKIRKQEAARAEAA